MNKTMTIQQINKAIDQEIWKMRGNEEAMQKMLNAARQIRILYVTPNTTDSQTDVQEQKESRLSERILALDNEQDGFFRMAGILGHCDTTVDKLREEALYDKYGV